MRLFMRPVVGGPEGLSPGVRVDLGCRCRGGAGEVHRCRSAAKE